MFKADGVTIWTLKPGLEKKFSTGHPWIFSNDLSQSPKGISPGESIELRAATGQFLAYGYGHPNTLIAFRALAKDAHHVVNETFWVNQLQKASRLRVLAGVFNWSHRLCYAEGDGLPGLVIDRYRLRDENGPAQAFVIQSSTAGIDHVLNDIVKAVEALALTESARASEGPTACSASGAVKISLDRTAIILAKDSKSRVLEGLPVEPKALVRTFPGFRPERAIACMQPPLPQMKDTLFTLDLIGGQKTGFFLDQRANVAAVAQSVAARMVHRAQPLRVLDLCCYVGQWGAQMAHLGATFGQKFVVTLVDSSQKALDLACENVEANGGHAEGFRLDLLDDLGKLANGFYDIVICDPPAFIKRKKDLATGEAAYQKVNREAMKKVAEGGLYFSSSCSGLLQEEDFRKILAKAVSVQKGREIRWIWRGSHSPDHPQHPAFPQGTYLKSWLGVALNR